AISWRASRSSPRRAARPGPCARATPSCSGPASMERGKSLRRLARSTSFERDREGRIRVAGVDTRRESVPACLKIDATTKRVRLDPHAPEFVQDPYAAYAALHEACPTFFWEDYGFWCLGGM